MAKKNHKIGTFLISLQNMDFRNPIEEESYVTGFDGTNCICVRNRTGASMVQVEVDTALATKSGISS